MTEETTACARREKLPIHRQIGDMKRKGIKFTIISESKAEEFLRNSNFYFKLKAYEKNYDKYPEDNPKLIAAGTAGQYMGLEFAYLQELSTLDMHLREKVLNMCLAVEHFLRVHLMRDIAENELLDGYSIVKDYERCNPNIKETIQSKKKNSYCEPLIDNYPEEMPVWVFLEVISFGDLITFAKMYYDMYPSKLLRRDVLDSLPTVRYIRNAAAHNNCLLNDLHPNNADFSLNRSTSLFVSEVPGISQKVRDKKLSNRTVHDFVTLLFVFNEIVTSQQAKKSRFLELKDLLDKRFVRHKDYFINHGTLHSTYDFVKKVVDKLYFDAYNGDVA